MPFLHTRPSEIRAPEVLVLPDARKRLTRFYRVAHLGLIPEELDFAWGEVDLGVAPAGFDGLRLVARKFSDVNSLLGEAGGNDPVGVLELVYEQIDASAETAVGERRFIRGDDGRVTIVEEFVQFSTGTYVPGVVGTTAASGYATAVLIREEAPDDGTLRRITRTFMTGGEIRRRTFRQGTFAALSITSALTPPATPVGYVVVDEQVVESPLGYPVYTYTFFSLSDAGYSTERMVGFLYPGRAKVYSVTYGGRKRMDLFRSPPVQAQVKATVTVSFQTSDSFTLPGDFWNPKDWAVLQASWIGFGNNPHGQVEALPGYRAVSETALEETAGGVAPYDLTCLSNPVYGSTVAKLQVTGGPADPGGNTYTLDVELSAEPAFITSSGTKYYRKTVVVATIPTQAALPV